MSQETAHHNHPAFPGERAARFPLDPPPEYADWRRAEGLRRAERPDGSAVWVVNRYADIREALLDPRHSADSQRYPLVVGASQAADVPATFPRMDDPEHAAIRRILTGDFTVKRVNALRPRIENLTRELIDTMIDGGGSADLVREFALPLPSLVISLLLGVPYQDHEFFQNRSATMLDQTIPGDERNAAVKSLFDYLTELLTHLERQPTDGLLSRLLRERVATGELQRNEVAMTGVILLLAGHETTSNMIALSTLALLLDPDQAARVRDTDDPAVIANAVEELLRYLTIAQTSITRVATEDVTIAGQLVPAGDVITMNLPAGNRDAARFTDPDVLDVDRDTLGHLAFGYGVHQCLGQNLARAELQIALPQLLRRLPGLRVAVPVEELAFRRDTVNHGVTELPVIW